MALKKAKKKIGLTTKIFIALIAGGNFRNNTI